MCLRLRYLDDLKTWNWILGWDICMYVDVCDVCGCMDGWMDGWMDGRDVYMHTCICMCVCVCIFCNHERIAKEWYW